MPVTRVDHGQQRGGDADIEVSSIPNPEYRAAIKQQVTQGAATGCGDCGNDYDTKQVQAAPAGGKCAADCEYGNAKQFDEVQDGQRRLLELKPAVCDQCDQCDHCGKCCKKNERIDAFDSSQRKQNSCWWCVAFSAVSVLALTEINASHAVGIILSRLPCFRPPMIGVEVNPRKVVAIRIDESDLKVSMVVKVKYNRMALSGSAATKREQDSVSDPVLSMPLPRLNAEMPHPGEVGFALFPSFLGST